MHPILRIYNPSKMLWRMTLKLNRKDMKKSEFMDEVEMFWDKLDQTFIDN